ncbi:MAG: hypothetical protein AAFR87_03155 [Bacteroidota bacterium]
MKTLSIIIALVLCINNLKAGDTYLLGSVKSDLDIALFNVSIQLKGGAILGKTDCEGKFRIKAEKGDTLELSMPNYESTVWVVDTFSEVSLILRFNYAQLKTKLETHSVFQALCKGSSSEPLYVIDGKTMGSPNFHLLKRGLKEENISSLFILKDPKVLDLLGPCAATGTIWITTTCSFQTSD